MAVICMPGVGRRKRVFMDGVSTHFPSNSSRKYWVPAALLQSWDGTDQTRYSVLVLVPPEGQGTLEEPVYCPPSPKPAARVSLSALNKVC